MKKPSLVSIISLTVALSLTCSSALSSQSKNKSKANQAEIAKIEKYRQACKKQRLDNPKAAGYGSSDENGTIYLFDKNCRFIKKE